MIQPSSRPFEMTSGCIFSADLNCSVRLFHSWVRPRDWITAWKSWRAAVMMP